MVQKIFRNRAMKRRFCGHFLLLSVAAFYLFLYLPFILLIIFSFNNDPFVFHWQGFTTQWYAHLFKSIEIRSAFQNSVIVASISAVLSLCMGTLLVCYAVKNVVTKLQPLFYAILIIPEIIVAVSMLGYFAHIGVPVGFTTLIAGHTLLGLGYVVPMVYDRFLALDKRLLEAAYDLGASRTQVIRTIIIPLLRPTLFSSALLTFIVSFDDFVISFFCAGGSAQTLPMYIFAIIKAGMSPVVAALATMLLILSSLLVAMFSILNARSSQESIQ